MIASPDPLSTAPVFWTEVFSRPDARWFSIDPIRGHVNDHKVFDPSPSNINVNPSIQLGSAIYPHRYVRTTGTKVENRMVYVLAFEEDGYARDVTRRYAREYSAKVAKVQGGSSAPNIGGGGKGRQAWWSSVMNAIHRPFRLVSIPLQNQVSTDEPDNFVLLAPRRFRRSRAGIGSNDGRDANNHGRI